MGQILIRNIDDAVLEALRKRAASQGVSLEQEARATLARAAGLTRAEAIARLDAVRLRLGSAGGSTLDDLKADRRRDG